MLLDEDYTRRRVDIRDNRLIINYFFFLVVVLFVVKRTFEDKNSIFYSDAPGGAKKIAQQLHSGCTHEDHEDQRYNSSSSAAELCSSPPLKIHHSRDHLQYMIILLPRCST